MKMQLFLIKNRHKIDGQFSRQSCLDPNTDPVLKKWWIRFVLRGWDRIWIRSISDRIRNPDDHLPLKPKKKFSAAAEEGRKGTDTYRLRNNSILQVILKCIYSKTPVLMHFSRMVNIILLLIRKFRSSLYALFYHFFHGRAKNLHSKKNVIAFIILASCQCLLFLLKIFAACQNCFNKRISVSLRNRSWRHCYIKYQIHAKAILEEAIIF